MRLPSGRGVKKVSSSSQSIPFFIFKISIMVVAVGICLEGQLKGVFQFLKFAVREGAAFGFHFEDRSQEEFSR